jgi:hypothetical protein
MKLLFILMLSVSSFAVFSAQVETDGDAIICQAEQSKMAVDKAEAEKVKDGSSALKQ